MRLRDNLRVSAQGFSLFHQERAVKCVLKCFYAKITCGTVSSAKGRCWCLKQRLLPRAWSPCHLYLPPPPLAPFFWHTRCAVQWQVSQDRLHRIGQSDHFCLHRTESKFFQCIFFFQQSINFKFWLRAIWNQLCIRRGIRRARQVLNFVSWLNCYQNSPGHSAPQIIFPLNWFFQLVLCISYRTVYYFPHRAFLFTIPKQATKNPIFFSHRNILVVEAFLSHDCLLRKAVQWSNFPELTWAHSTGPSVSYGCNQSSGWLVPITCFPY